MGNGGGREGGNTILKQLFQRLTPNRARNSVHQATCRAKLFIGKNTRAQLFRAKKPSGTAI